MSRSGSNVMSAVSSAAATMGARILVLRKKTYLKGEDPILIQPLINSQYMLKAPGVMVFYLKSGAVCMNFVAGNIKEITNWAGSLGALDGIDPKVGDVCSVNTIGLYIIFNSGSKAIMEGSTVYASYLIEDAKLYHHSVQPTPDCKIALVFSAPDDIQIVLSKIVSAELTRIQAKFNGLAQPAILTMSQTGAADMSKSLLVRTAYALAGVTYYERPTVDVTAPATTPAQKIAVIAHDDLVAAHNKLFLMLEKCYMIKVGTAGQTIEAGGFGQVRFTKN